MNLLKPVTQVDRKYYVYIDTDHPQHKLIENIMYISTQTTRKASYLSSIASTVLFQPMLAIYTMLGI